MTTVKPLRVLVISDDLPGHYNQSKGIIAAVERTRPVQNTWLSVELSFGLARNMMRIYLNRLPMNPSLRLLRIFYRFAALPAEPIDLIVSAGGRTSFFNAWLARALGVPNIYSGSLRRLSPELFTAVITLEPVPNADNNIVLPIHACAIDAQKVSRKGEALREKQGWGSRKIWTLLLGGDGAGYRYTEDDWSALAKLMSALAERHGMHWLVVSSRRTPELAERCILNICPSNIMTCRWISQGNKIDIDIEACLGVAENIFVTEDSMTMLTEAIYSIRPVYSLRPEYSEPDARYEKTVQRFSDNGMLTRHSINGLLNRPSQFAKDVRTIMQESPLDALTEILEQLVVPGEKLY